MEGYASTPISVAYGASKAAFRHLTVSMANERAAWAIRVNILSPGPFASDMITVVEEHQPGTLAMLAEGNSQKRVADVREIVGPVLYLASTASSFVTGGRCSIVPSLLARLLGGRLRVLDEGRGTGYHCRKSHGGGQRSRGTADVAPQARGQESGGIDRVHHDVHRKKLLGPGETVQPQQSKPESSVADCEHPRISDRGGTASCEPEEPCG
jgi:uncharacterized protein